MHHRLKTLLITMLTILMCFTFSSPASADTPIIRFPVKPIPWLTLPSPTLVWQHPIGTGSIIGPEYVAGHLFIAVSDTLAGNHVYAYDLYYDDGQFFQLFDFDQRITSLSSRTDYYGTTLYIGTQSKLYAYKIEYIYGVNTPPTLLWTLSLGNTIDHAVFDSLGNLYVLSNAEFNSKLTVINRSGKVLWSYPFADYFGSPPAIDRRNVVYAGSLSGKLYAISTRNPVQTHVPGTDIYRLSLTTPALEWKATLGKSTDTIYPTVKTYTNEVYASSTTGGIFALNTNGTVKWHYPLVNDEVHAAPLIISDGTVYFGTAITGQLYALSPGGALKWKYSPPATIMQNAVIGTPSTIGYGIIFFGTSSHNVYAVRPDGTGLWRFHANGSIAVAPIGNYYGVRTYVVTASGMVYCLGTQL